MAAKMPKYLQERARVIAELDAWRDAMIAAVNDMHEYAVGLATDNEDHKTSRIHIWIPAEKTAADLLQKYGSRRADARTVGIAYRKMMALRAKKESEASDALSD